MPDGKVVQQFVADDAQYRRAQEEQIKNTVRQQNETDKLAAKSKQAALEDLKNTKAVQQAMAELVRQTQELKRARGELIRSTDFVRTSRDGGAMIPAPYSPNWMRSQAYRVGYNSPASPAGFLGYRVAPGAPDFTIPPPVIPRLGYTQRSNISTLHAAEDGLRMASTLPVIFGSVARQVVGIVGGYLAIETALQAVNQQMQVNVDLHKGAADAQKLVAGGQAEIALNTFGRTPAERQKLYDAGKRITGDTGFKPIGAIERTLGRQAGRGGDLSLDQIISATDIAAHLTRHTPEQLEPTAQGIQQLMKYGVPTAAKAAALFQAAASEAYPGDPGLQARMLQQSVASGMANLPKGAQNAQSAEEILELSAAASQVGGEERGEAVRTAMVALIAQKQEFVEGRGPFAVSGRFGRVRHPKVAGAPESPRAFFEWLRQNPMQGRRFWEKANFERQYEGVLRSMLMDPNSDQAKALAGVQERVHANVPALTEQLQAIEGGTPQLKTATQGATSESRQTLADAAKTISARRDLARQIVADTMQSSAPYGRRTPFMQGFYQRLADPFGRHPEETGLKFLRERRAEMEHTWSMSGAIASGPRPTSPEAELNRRLLDEQIKVLTQIRDEIRDLYKAQPTPAAAPAANAQRNVHGER
jgi:hypothetical protein